MLKLCDIIRLAGISLSNFKIHCATGEGSRPLEAFFDGSWKEWQERQSKKNFECDHTLSLIHLAAAAGILLVSARFSESNKATSTISRGS